MSKNDSLPVKQAAGSSVPWFTIGWVLAGGIVLRLLWIVLCPNSPVSDQVVYHQTATMIAGGHGYVFPDGSPGGWWPVGYSAVLSVVYGLFGHHYIVAYFLNCALGAASILGCYLLGRDLFSRAAGLWAAVGFAAHPTFVLYTTVHGSENAAIAGEVWFLWLCVFLVKRGDGRQWIGYGVAGLLLGATVYVRATVLLLGVSVMLLGWLLKRSPKSWLSGTAVVGLVTILTLLPWGFRNQAVFGSFQLLSMNGGSNLWMGNHEGASGGYSRLPKFVKGMELVDSEALLRSLAVDFILSDPASYAGLCARRTVDTLRSDTIGVVWNSAGITARFGEAMIIPLKMLCTAVHYLILTCFLASLVAGLWSRSLRREHVFLGVVILLVAAPFILIVGGNRYHLPMMPFLMVWVGEVVARATGAMRARRAT